MATKQKRMKGGPPLYTTHQLDLKLGDQVRISYGRRTMFVYVNGRGINILKGGYCPKEVAR